MTRLRASWMRRLLFGLLRRGECDPCRSSVRWTAARALRGTSRWEGFHQRGDSNGGAFGSSVRWSAEGPPVRLLYGTEAGELVAPQSGVVVPILSGDRVLGVLSAQSYRPEAYEDADVLSLGAIGRASGSHQTPAPRTTPLCSWKPSFATMNDARPHR